MTLARNLADFSRKVDALQRDHAEYRKRLDAAQSRFSRERGAAQQAAPSDDE